MAGYVEKRGKDSWRIVVETTREADGTRKRISRTFKGKKKDAEAEMHRMAAEIANGIYVEPVKLTFGEYLDRWLPSHAKSKLSPTSHLRYKKEIDNRIRPLLGHILIEKLNPLTIQNFVDEIEKQGRLDNGRPLSAEMIKYTLKVVKKSLKQAVLWGMLPRNPAENISSPKDTKKKEMQILTEGQIKNLLSVLKSGQDHQKYLLILLLLSTGLRLGEALALTWQDIAFTDEIISVNKLIQRIQGQGILIKPPKTESSIRKVTIESKLVAALKYHRLKQKERRLKLGAVWKGGDSEQVFTGPRGGFMTNSSAENWWSKFRAQHGLESIRLHDMRHTHITHLLASGKMDIKTISERVGHKNASMTLNIYSHVLPAKQREAAQVLSHLWL